MFRPCSLINLYILNSTEDKLLVAKKYIHNFWEVPGQKLGFGEKFEVCAKRILMEETSISIEDSQRFKFICTCNAVDKDKKLHFLNINFFVKMTNEEESKINMNSYFYQYWKWLTYEEVLKMEDLLFFSIQLFLKTYKITKLSDIQTLLSN